jgi:hypothetical protein
MATRKKPVTKTYKTIDDNPEVFDPSAVMVEDIKENLDGSSTIQLKFTQDQVDMLFDVSLRQALVQGLKSLDADSAHYANLLSAVARANEFAKLATKWETSDSMDWTPKVSKALAKLNLALEKIERS